MYGGCFDLLSIYKIAMQSADNERQQDSIHDLFLSILEINADIRNLYNTFSENNSDILQSVISNIALIQRYHHLQPNNLNLNAIESVVFMQIKAYNKILSKNTALVPYLIFYYYLNIDIDTLNYIVNNIVNKINLYTICQVKTI